jgi:hypothetical protein
MLQSAKPHHAAWTRIIAVQRYFQWSSMKAEREAARTLNVRWDNSDSCPNVLSSCKVVHFVDVLLDVLMLLSATFDLYIHTCVKTISSSTYGAMSR